MKHPDMLGNSKLVAPPVDSGQKVSHDSGQNCSGQVVAEWNLRRHQRLVSSPAGLLSWNPLCPAIIRWEPTNLNAQWAKYFQRNNANQTGIANFQAGSTAPGILRHFLAGTDSFLCFSAGSRPAVVVRDFTDGHPRTRRRQFLRAEM